MTVDDLRVPDGASCDLLRTTIKGQLKVETDATLRASALRLTGNLQSEGASRWPTRRWAARCRSSREAGADVSSNAVTGDIQLFENRGGIVVSRNRVDGNLQCQENAPAPTGGGNVVRGNAEDQCAVLAGGEDAQAGPGVGPPAPAPQDQPAPAPQGSTVPAAGDDDDDDRAGDDDDITPRRSRVDVRRGARTIVLRVRCDDDDDRSSGTAVLVRSGKTLGRMRYSVGSGRAASARVVLTRAGRAALRRKGALRVELRSDDVRRTLVLVRR